MLIETGGHPVKEVGPVHVVLDIFLAGPDDLYGAVDVLGDLDRTHDAVDLESPPEAAAEQMIVNLDLLRRQPGGLRRGGMGTAQDLCSDPDLAAVLPQVDRAVHRLQRGMSEKRQLVGRLDLGRGARHGRLDVALTARNGARALRCTLELPDDIRRAEGRVRALVPFDLERREALLRCPHMVGDDSHRIVEAHHLTHALDRHRLAVVDALHATAKDR